VTVCFTRTFAGATLRASFQQCARFEARVRDFTDDARALDAKARRAESDLRMFSNVTPSTRFW